MKSAFTLTLALLYSAFFSPELFAAESTDNAVTIQWKPQPSEIKSFKADAMIGALGAGLQAQLLANGVIDRVEDAEKLLSLLLESDPDKKVSGTDRKVSGTYILNVAGWMDSTLATTKFNNWYLYDSDHPNPKFLVMKPDEWLLRRAIPGKKNFFVVYLHVAGNVQDSVLAMALSKGAVSYAVSISKRKSTFAADLDTLISIVKPVVGIASIPPVQTHPAAYSAILPVHTEFAVSDVNITSSAPAQRTGASSATLSTVKYTNEAPAWAGLSFAVPIKSYNEINVDFNAGTAAPKKVEKKDAYACLDLYIPAIEAVLRNRTYLPHAFVGLPITGKVFRRPMAGISAGYLGIEVYYGAIYDMENRNPLGGRDAKWKDSYGIKISVDAAKAAFAKVTGK